MKHQKYELVQGLIHKYKIKIEESNIKPSLPRSYFNFTHREGETKFGLKLHENVSQLIINNDNKI